MAGFFLASKMLSCGRRRMQSAYDTSCSSFRSQLTAAVLAVLCLSALLTGCSTRSGARIGFLSGTAPVIAIMQDELFVGEAERSVAGMGKIDVRSAADDSVRCVGRFGYTGALTGDGSLQCSDGSKATFSFNALSVLSGYGYGESSRGGGFSFTYGMTPEESTPYLVLPRGRNIERRKGGGLGLTPL